MSTPSSPSTNRDANPRPDDENDGLVENFSAIYSAYGLKIVAPLLCPEMQPWVGDEREPDVLIRFGLVTAASTDWSDDGNHDRLLLTVERIARFLIQRGQEIVIEPAPGSHAVDIRAYLFGSALGALLHQRGCLVLHGSAVEINDKAVVFVGRSGIGKSTLAAAFGRCGYRILADDVCAIDPTVLDSPAIYHGLRRMKLWQDSAAKLDYDVTGMPKVLSKLDKYSLPLLHEYVQAPLAISSVYALNIHERNDFVIEELVYWERFKALLQNTYRLNYLHSPALVTRHFMFAQKVANLLPVKRVSRPQRDMRLRELMDCIEADVRGEAQPL